MNSPIDYTTEARRINELVSMRDRENAYASLASRLRERLSKLEDLLKEVEWEPPMPGQRPFTRGYNLAMMQVNKALNGSESK